MQGFLFFIMYILGIESSCDETSAAVYHPQNGLLSNVVASQHIHSKFGGVVPELASRAHQRNIVPTIEQALKEAAVTADKIQAIAVARGPGLIGSLLVGFSFAKALAQRWGTPIIPVNHVDAHLYAAFLDGDDPDFPFLGLIVSGGHTQIVLVEAPAKQRVLGKTLDDAAGEAFDKTGKMLNLPYPAGPVMDKLSKKGNGNFHRFPRSMMDESLDFSFSGLKTSVLYYLNKHYSEGVSEQELSDLCASISEAITDVLVSKMEKAWQQHAADHVVISGGVSANSMLKQKMHELSQKHGFKLHIPKPALCTDNAAMIASYGWQLLKAGELTHQPETLDKPFASYPF